MSNKKPLISVVIPNLNGTAFIGDCLRSLERQDFKDFEVILIDNGSTDGSVKLVRDEFPWLGKIIENRANLGFAKACNQGIESSPILAPISNTINFSFLIDTLLFLILNTNHRVPNIW